jgi:hypothetical protein
VDKNDFELLEWIDILFSNVDKEQCDLVYDTINATLDMLFDNHYIGRRKYQIAVNSLLAYRQGGYELAEAKRVIEPVI